MATREEIETARAERKAKLSSDAAEQALRDLEAINELELKHGDENIASDTVAYSPGLPTMWAVRTPTEAEIKRFRARVKPSKDGSPGDGIAAAVELGSACRVYPEAEAYAKLLKARPGIDTALGTAALKLSAGAATEEGKG